MSGKLDKSLDEILSTQRRTGGGRRNPARRTTTGRKPATSAPAGGIQKTTKTARNAVKPPPAKVSGATGESKIMVSNLVRGNISTNARISANKSKPKDVSEPQIKVC